MICPNCNTNNADSAKFCAGCGAELNANAPVSFGMPVDAAPVAPAPEPTPVTAPVDAAPVAPAPAYAPVPDPMAVTAPIDAAPAQAVNPVQPTPVAQPQFTPAPAYAPVDPAYAAPVAPGMDYGAPVQKKSKLGLIIGISAGAVAIIVAVLLFIFLGGNSPEKVLEDYYYAIAEGDGMVVYEHSVNSYALAGELEDYDGSEQDLIADFVEDIRENYADNLEEYGYDAKLKTFSILSKTEYTKEEIAKIAAYANERCGIPMGSLEDVCVLNVYTDFGGSEDSDTNTRDVVMGKIDGKWYVDIIGPEGNISSKSRIDNILDK